MERLTFTDAEMKNIGENFDCPVRDNPLVDRFCEVMCAKFQADCPYKEMGKKLKAYEDVEEQGLLLRLPCKRGDDVYIIPSKVNYDLNVLNKHEENNRVHHQKVENITFNRNGWYVECDKDVEYGTDRICIEQHFGITWFLDPTKAEQKLAEMKRE